MIATSQTTRGRAAPKASGIEGTVARRAVPLLGAIIGDVVGSVFEGSGWKTKQFPLLSPTSRFTDGTVLTVATADALVMKKPYTQVYRDYARRFPAAGYGDAFKRWFAARVPVPYGSFGNGSAMRASPIGWAAASLNEALREARRSAEVTHDHVEGIKGAQAVAAGVYLARTGISKLEIRSYLERTFGYDLRRTLEDIRPNYAFDVSCQGSVPEAIIAFLEADDFKDALRNAVSLGGDADTQASIAGALSHAFGDEIPMDLEKAVRSLLPKPFVRLLDRFALTFHG